MDEDRVTAFAGTPPPSNHEPPVDRGPERDFLSGGGQMGAIIRGVDWCQTALGAPETWSPSLRTVVSLLLSNRFPLLLWWGSDYIQIYNDAYRPVLGAKHPRSMAQPARECWPEIWHIIGPLIDTPFRGGPATWMDDLSLELERHGFPEETHFTVAYSPVPDPSAPRGIGGVLATVHEITDQVIGERRVRVLRDLGLRSLDEAQTADAACAAAANILSTHPRDVPFALLYLVEPDRTSVHLAGAAGVEPGSDVSPRLISLGADAEAEWPIGDALRCNAAQVVERLAGRFARVPEGPWSDPPHTAVVLPIPSNVGGRPAGALVAGVSSRLRLDERYQGFLELLTTQLATAIANARAYEEEKRRVEQLAELDRAKTAFFSNVSHEFRTPLTLMLGPLEDALAAPAAALPERREQLEVAHRNALRLLRLVNTLLDFSRIEAGRVRASYEPVDLARLTTELASVFRAATDRAGLRLTVDCPQLGEPVWVDREMWEKIVLNLISNAFKFTLAGGIGVRLFRDGHMAVLEVEDTGAGVPSDEIRRLFDRFHRVEGVQGRTHEGTGIGLSLVQELVRLHGGTVAVRSALGQGSTFTIRVPFGAAHLPPERVRSGTRAASTSIGAQPFVEEALRWLPGAGGHGASEEIERELVSEPAPAAETTAAQATILLADDNADMRAYLARLLSTRYTVRAVADGAAAWDVVQSPGIDLVLSDVMMPRLDGFGLLRRIRADPVHASLPVVLLSARAGEEASIEGREAGADDYLVKPFSARELLTRVAANLERATLRRELEQRARADLEAMTRLQAVGAICARAGSTPAGCVGEVLDAAIFLTQADMGNVQLFDPASGTLQIAVQRGFEEPFLTFFARVNAGEPSACGAAMHDTKRVLVEDVTQSDIFVGQPSLEVVLAAGVRAVQSTPLVASDGTLLGVISTHFREPRRLSDQALPFMDLLARQAADYLGRVRAEEAVEQARASAVAANRAKSEFLAAMSHELRTPLNAIAGYVQLLQMGIHGPLTEGQMDVLRRVQMSEQHLLSRINDVLDFAKLEAGRARYQLADVALDAAVADAGAIMQAEVMARGLTYEAAVPSDVTVLADRDKLLQVLLNLLSNAVKFSPRGGVIRLDVPHRDGMPERAVFLRITDAGVGIARAKQDAIFEPFVQIDRSLAQPTEGTGLGLAISRELARGMGGDLRVRSVEREGSSFTVTLRRGNAAVAAS